ncbi:MAG: hypothetical protein ACJAXL_000460, partial [Alphaproteobacteria bacterium]
NQYNKDDIKRFIYSQEGYHSFGDFPKLATHNFSHATFYHPVNFRGFIFNNEVLFDGIIFQDIADFSNIKFLEKASFRETKFRQKAKFTHTKFMQSADFWGAELYQYADFSSAEFTDDVDFENIVAFKNIEFKSTKFMGWTTFQNATFEQKSYFIHAIFTKDATFSLVTFKKDADFFDVKFGGNIDFSNAEFLGNIMQFNQCIFKKPTYDEAEFSFKNTVFQVKINFSESIFEHLPELTGADFRGGINLDKVIFPKDIKGNLKTYQDAELTWHTFQTEMEKAGNHEKAIEYFGYELDARRYNKKTNRVFKIVLWCYKLFSNYGQSISRPLLLWFGLIIFFWLIHYGFIGYIFGFFIEQDIWIALKFAVRNSFPFLSDQTTFYDRIFGDTQYYHTPIPFNNMLELYIFPALHGIHTFFSLIFIFLFGLGIRNRLRLK